MKFLDKKKFLDDSAGQVQIVGAGIAAITLVIVLTIFAGVWNGTNQGAFDTATRSTVDLVPLVLAAAVLLAILIGVLGARARG